MGTRERRVSSITALRGTLADLTIKHGEAAQRLSELAYEHFIDTGFCVVTDNVRLRVNEGKVVVEVTLEDGWTEEYTMPLTGQTAAGIIH